MDLLSHDLFVKLSVMLWAIWYARRKAIHEGIFQSPHATYSFITRFIEELSIISDKPTSGSAAPNIQGHGQRPSAPPTGYHKVHVDAAVRQGRGGSVSAVCRDGNGNFIGSSSWSRGYRTRPLWRQWQSGKHLHLGKIFIYPIWLFLLIASKL